MSPSLEMRSDQPKPETSLDSQGGQGESSSIIHLLHIPPFKRRNLLPFSEVSPPVQGGETSGASDRGVFKSTGTLPDTDLRSLRHPDLVGGTVRTQLPNPKELDRFNTPPFAWSPDSLGYWRRETFSHQAKGTDLPTGLEALSTGELLDRANEAGAFRRVLTSRVLLTTPWSRMVEEEFLRSPPATRFFTYLRDALAGKRVIELGVGDNASVHGRLFKEMFDVREYIPVDVRLCPGVIQASALRFLVNEPTDSTCIVAFGLFNEPLSPLINGGFTEPAASIDRAQAGHFELEYLRRLATEMSRVLSRDGLLFGDGLYPLQDNDTLAVYMRRDGLRHDDEGYKRLDDALRDAFIERSEGGLYFREKLENPFFLRKD